MARIQGYLGRNQQLWDLGVTDTTNLTMVQHRINQLDAGFDLVMIAEQFEESLVLLSHQLCWPLANLTRSVGSLPSYIYTLPYQLEAECPESVVTIPPLCWV